MQSTSLLCVHEPVPPDVFISVSSAPTLPTLESSFELPGVLERSSDPTFHSAGTAFVVDEGLDDPAAACSDALGVPVGPLMRTKLDM
jgi:hypothetical protein